MCMYIFAGVYERECGADVPEFVMWSVCVVRVCACVRAYVCVCVFVRVVFVRVFRFRFSCAG